MRNLKIIKLKIISCKMTHKCWYENKIGKSFYFFDKIFEDDGEHKQSVWKATLPTHYYAHIEDTNYNSQIRKLKLKKINEKM